MRVQPVDVVRRERAVFEIFSPMKYARAGRPSVGWLRVLGKCRNGPSSPRNVTDCSW